MTYSPERQYRCTIIRGKAKNDIDDLLQAYASIIADRCPCSEKTFSERFDRFLARFLTSPTAKTLANHRTEIAGKLFGMYHINSEGLVVPAERTKRLLETSDQPEFFKDVVHRIQFPNGMDKIYTIRERVRNRISIRPCAFVLRLILSAAGREITLTKNEIAYYALNSLDVLRGGVTADAVLDVIEDMRRKNIFRKVETPGKASSYSMQHITELLNIMELANLIRIYRKGMYSVVQLNASERESAEHIAADTRPGFDIYSYNLGSKYQSDLMYGEWSLYYTEEDHVSRGIFMTRAGSLAAGMPALPGVTAVELGEEGEMIVFEYEKRRVGRFNPRLASKKVLYFGKQKGLGYDITSIRAEIPDPEHPIYIEVKTTKRVTVPRSRFHDQFTLTRNEWVAAEYHKDSYFIFRVYITNEGVRVYRMKNPVKMYENRKIYAVPDNYRVEFDCSEDLLGDLDE